MISGQNNRNLARFKIRTLTTFYPLQLFVSKRSVFDGKKAIRGGVPFVFPIFGPSTVMPQHGFARISRFETSDIHQSLHE